MRKIKENSKTMAIVKLVLLLIITIGIPMAIFLLYPESLEIIKDKEKLAALLSGEHRMTIMLIYVGMQMAQVIITLIPGQAVQFAGGYAFGVLLGSILSFIGILLGTMVAYYLAKLLGKDAMHLIFGEERFQKFTDKLNSKKASVTLFLLYLIPGFPKDMIAYVAGASEYRILPLLLISLLGRAPAMMITIFLGKSFNALL